MTDDLPSRPAGPTLRRALRAVQELNQTIPPEAREGVHAKIRQLGHGLVRAADRMDAGDRSAMDHLTAQDIGMLLVLAHSYETAVDIFEAANAADAESN